MFNDREYQFGDHPDEVTFATFGNVVGAAPGGATYDSAGVPQTQTLHDLTPGGFPPLYVNVGPAPGGLARPGAPANNRGVQFSADGWLQGERLGAPLTTDSSTGGTAGGTLDYSGLYNRGFQLWVRPGTQATAAVQDVVLDTNQHGVRISATGFWVQRYNGADVTTTAPVAFNAWSHVMVARPYGLATPTGGSILYVNGVAVGAAAGSYNAAEDFFLTVGGSTGAAPAGTNLFTGVVDQLTMFVVGKTLNGVDRGTFNFRTDNAFAAQPFAMGGLTANPADVNQDGSLTAADVTDFVDGWLTEKRVNGVRVGDMTTIRDGDLNFDGITDLADAHLLNQALLVATGQGLDFGLLPVPEPSTAAMAATLFAFAGAAPAAGEPRQRLISSHRAVDEQRRSGGEACSTPRLLPEFIVRVVQWR